MKEDQREKFDYDLTAPLPGQPDHVTPAMAEAEGEAFMAMLAMTKKEPAGGAR